MVASSRIRHVGFFSQKTCFLIFPPTSTWYTIRRGLQQSAEPIDRSNSQPITGKHNVTSRHYSLAWNTIAALVELHDSSYSYTLAKLVASSTSDVTGHSSGMKGSTFYRNIYGYGGVQWGAHKTQICCRTLLFSST